MSQKEVNILNMVTTDQNDLQLKAVHIKKQPLGTTEEMNIRSTQQGESIRATKMIFLTSSRDDTMQI